MFEICGRGNKNVDELFIVFDSWNIFVKIDESAIVNVLTPPWSLVRTASVVYLKTLIRMCSCVVLLVCGAGVVPVHSDNSQTRDFYSRWYILVQC